MIYITLILTIGLFPTVDPPEKVAGVVVYGDLTEPEKKLLRGLKERMVPLPDTIRVVYRERDNASTSFGSSTILLGKSRIRPPYKAEGYPPYLYGRVRSTPSIPLPGEYHTLAHEIAHLLQWKMYGGKPKVSSPHWWSIDEIINPFRAQVEIEAELIAAALESMVFGTSPKNLGYPKETWSGNTDSLVQNYTGKLGDFYKFPVASDSLDDTTN